MSQSSRRRYFTMPAIDQPDPEPGFQHSSEEFIIPAKDEDGESVRGWFTLPAQLHGWVGQIVASKQFPFVRDGDLFRYGVYLACVQLSRIDRKVPSLRCSIDAMNQVVNHRDDMSKIVDHVQHLRKVVDNLVRKQAWGEIQYLLARERRSAKELLLTEPFWA